MVDLRERIRGVVADGLAIDTYRHGGAAAIDATVVDDVTDRVMGVIDELVAAAARHAWEEVNDVAGQSSWRWEDVSDEDQDARISIAREAISTAVADADSGAQNG